MQSQDRLKKLFLPCSSSEEFYQKIIELGRSLPRMPKEFKTEENIVSGCQSLVYLHSQLRDGKIFFEADSESLISRGLAAILIFVYSEHPPEVILKCPPDFIKELGLEESLTPSRSNGLYSMHLKMKQEALKFLITSNFTKH